MVRDQPLRRGDEVIENILLMQLGAGEMPVFAVLAAAAQVGLSVNASHLKPHQVRHRERGRKRNVEAAVSIEQHAVLAVEFEPFLVSEKHRDACTVFALIENLRGFIAAGVKIDLWFAKDRAGAFFRVVTIDDVGYGKAGEDVERFFIRTLAAETYRRADPWQINLA